jgi:phosphoribosyl 1,2-cyclic phosphodiesterase
MLESNHDLDMLDNGSYPVPLKKRIKGQNGHLCNDMAAQTIAELAGLGVKRFIIGHLSRENNIPELAYRTVEDCLYNHGFLVGRDVELDVVLRDTTSRVFLI